MTFAARTFQGMSQGAVVVGISNVFNNTSPTAGIRSGSLTLNTDGTISLLNGTGSGAWYSPTGAGAGTGVWVKIAVSGTNTTVSGSATGTWFQLTSAVGWTFANSSTTVEAFGTYTLSFAADSGGVNVIGAGAGSWDVGQTH
jgi:hypothetical protein